MDHLVRDRVVGYINEERDALEDAKQFLASLLADAPMPAKRVYSEAREAGHSGRTIRRAQKALGVEAVKEGMHGGWVWKLPPKMAKTPEDGHTKSLDAFDGQAEARRQRAISLLERNPTYGAFEVLAELELNQTKGLS